MAVRPVRFVPNPLGIALLARTPAMSAGMVARAQAVADTAREIAPVGSSDDHYRDNIDATAIVVGGRAGGRVNARKFTSVWIEFGTSDTPAFAPLRTACDANGLELKGDTR